MKPVIFAGPTLWNDRATESGDFRWLPPAEGGDIIRAVRSRPVAIGLVDGRFETSLSTWHKEILWAMSRGVHVFGAASMGALRAAELSPFGMRGIGRIYRDFAEGRLRDDDEVAVLHAPSDLGYRPLSVAMVDVRATVDRALLRGTISARAAPSLVNAAKSIFYKDRTWAAIAAWARSCGLSERTMDRFLRWLPAGEVQLKRRDARAMLRAMKRFLASHPRPMKIDYAFQRTSFFQQLSEDVRSRPRRPD